MERKLKLSKITVVNLDRVKGGRPPCYCDIVITNGAQNRDNYTRYTVCYPPCNSVAYCYTEPVTVCTEPDTNNCMP